MTPLWHGTPHSLISWLDVEKFAAEQFVNIASHFAGLAQAMAGLPARRVTAKELEGLAKNLTKIMEMCREIGLEVSARQFDVSIKHLKTAKTTTQCSETLTCLIGAISSEMSVNLFLWIPVGHSQYYQVVDLFGPAVSSAFGSVVRDVMLAGNCYATGNNTACVFHCMRVLEKGLHLFATHLNVPFKTPIELENWQNIIEPIEKEIRRRESVLPKGSQKSKELQFMSEAAVQFRYFKEAWRNHVAHAREFYDETDARQIMDHVKQFMQSLSENGVRE